MRVWGSYWWSSNCWLSDRQPEIMWVEVRRAAAPAVLSSKTTDWIRHSLSQGHGLHIPRVGASSTARCVFTWMWDLMFHGWPCRITAELHRFICMSPISHNLQARLKLWVQTHEQQIRSVLEVFEMGTPWFWDEFRFNNSNGASCCKDPTVLERKPAIRANTVQSSARGFTQYF